MKTISTRTRRLVPSVAALSYALSITAFAVFAFSNLASAAALTQVSVRFDRMKASTFTTGTVCAKSGSAGQTSVTVTFPTAYTVSAVVGDWATSTTNLAWPTGASAWPTIGATATGVVGKAVTWSSGALTPATLYCFNWTNSTAALQTGVAGTYTGTVNTNIDSVTSFATAAIADDQIQVSATVAPTFTFVLSGNTDNLGQLSTSSVSVSPTPRTVAINTNAKNGWYVWAKDAAAGLTSAIAPYTIASTTPGANSTLATNAEGYNTGVTQTQTGGAGVVTVAAGYVGGSTGKGGGLDATLRTIASSTGTANNAVLTFTNNASIGALTPAGGDYTDTITVVGAGLF